MVSAWCFFGGSCVFLCLFSVAVALWFSSPLVFRGVVWWCLVSLCVGCFVCGWLVRVCLVCVGWLLFVFCLVFGVCVVLLCPLFVGLCCSVVRCFAPGVFFCSAVSPVLFMLLLVAGAFVLLLVLLVVVGLVVLLLRCFMILVVLVLVLF